MNNLVLDILSAIVPVLVAATTAFGAVTVAKVQQMQKSITTNHGTKGIGDATDKILKKVDDLTLTITALESRETALEHRMEAIEKSRARTLSGAQTPTRSFTIRKSHNWKRRRL